MRTLFIVLGLCGAALAQLPDAPSFLIADARSSTPKQQRCLQPIDPQPSGVLWIDQIQDSRPKRNVLTDPAFYFPEAVAWGATIADYRVNRNNPIATQGGSIAVDAFVPAAALSAVHFALVKWVPGGKWIGLGPMGWLTFWHVRGAATGKYH